MFSRQDSACEESLDIRHILDPGFFKAANHRHVAIGLDCFVRHVVNRSIYASVARLGHGSCNSLS